MLKAYFDLTKIGIVIFVILSGVAGYVTSFSVESVFDGFHLGLVLAGLYFLSSGSLALNQYQEIQLDSKMKRTSSRPIAAGKLNPIFALIISINFIFLGLLFLAFISLESFILGVLTIILYNGIYTYYWKPKWVYGAIPGAIPGALPVTIAYAANDSNIFKGDSVYLFLILFLWQIPHFWVLALKYKDDYAQGGVPVLPSMVPIEKTFQQIIIYTILYIAVAIASPWFVHTSFFYLIFVLPFVFFIIKSLITYVKSSAQQWMSFFMWLNFSMLTFLFVPIFDRWKLILSAFEK